MIKINKTVYGYCPEFDDNNHPIQIVSNSKNNANKATGCKCNDANYCKYIMTHGGQCPLAEKYINNL